MRADMHKVIVERERRKAAFGYHDVRLERRRIPENDESDKIPSRESMRRPYGYERKALNENLAPLRRFLRSCVGKPWDKVYSELSKNLRPSNAVQQHVREHLEDYVSFGVFVRDGYTYAPWRGGFGVSYRRLSRGDLFVNGAGILRELKYDRVKPTAATRGARGPRAV